MLQLIQDVPSNVVGIQATGKVTKKEYEDVFIPSVDKLAKSSKQVNLVFVINTDISQFTPGALFNDIRTGFKYFTKWHRVAIVTDQTGVQKLTDMYSNFVPGTYKGFPIARLEEAKQWVSGT